METKFKKIAVLTSGGDSPGMNAAVRAVVLSALGRGMEVVAVRRGYAGLMKGDLIPMKAADVSGILGKGGTVLSSARSLEFCTEEGIQKAVKTCKENGIEGIIVIGGDGSYRGAGDLSAHGIPCIGIPGTIDNDISSTDVTIGFDTSLNCVIELIDRLWDTITSHDRCSVVEVMGRHSGYIAIHAGIATGATYVMVPEIEASADDCIKKIKDGKAKGKNSFIVVVAEGVGHCKELAERIEKETGIVTRATILGHVQRGGSPTARDRVLASRLGSYAVKLLAEGKGNRIVGTYKDDLVDYDLNEGLAMKKPFPQDAYDLFNEINN